MRTQPQDYITYGFVNIIASRRESPDAEIRAHLLARLQLQGLMTSLTLDLNTAAGSMDRGELVERYGHGVQLMLTGNDAPPPSKTGAR